MLSSSQINVIVTGTLIMLIRRNVRLNVGRVTGEWPLSMLIIPCKHQYVRTDPYAAA